MFKAATIIPLLGEREGPAAKPWEGEGERGLRCAGLKLTASPALLP